jgi:hypothetical protein
MVAAFREQRDLALENLALRQQLGVLKRKGVPRLKRKDRVFWVVLSRVWPHWRKVLHLIEADTVVGWQRQAFRIYWAKISKQKSAGRRPVSTEVRASIRKMSQANPVGSKNSCTDLVGQSDRLSQVLAVRNQPTSYRFLLNFPRSLASIYHQPVDHHLPYSRVIRQPTG